MLQQDSHAVVLSSPADKANNGCIMRLVDVVKYFPSGEVTAVNHISLTIAEGEYIAIMGPSGCGKSTLLNLMGAIDQPTSGTVFFRDQALTELPSLDRFRSSQIGFVFQAFHLLPTLSAIENVQVAMFVQPWSVKERVERAKHLLETVGMSHRMNSLPNRLSIGERQRVAIARALANEPSILLADEPTGNLDSKNGQEVLKLFKRIHLQNMTLVVITHSDEVAKEADRIIYLKDGKIDREVTQKSQAT